MARRSNLARARRNFAWNLVGGGAYVAAQWAMLMALAKVGPEAQADADVGRFALALVVLQPLYQVLYADLRNVQATDARRLHGPALYLLARAEGVALALLASAAVAISWGRPTETTLTLLALACAKACEAGSDVCYGRFEQCERMELVARSQLARGLLGLVAFVGTYAMTVRVALAAFALAVAWGTVLVAHDAPGALRRSDGDPPAWPRPTLRTAFAMFARALPLGVVTGIASAAINTPSYVLEAQLGTAAVGRYAAIAYFVSALRMPAFAAGSALAPRLSRLLAAGDLGRARIWSAGLVAACAAPGLVGVAGAALVGPDLLHWIYHPGFTDLADALLVLLAGATIAFAAHGLRLSLTAAGRYASQLPAVIGLLVTTGAAAWWLVPHHGVLGAALALACGRLVQFGIYAIMVAGLLWGDGPAPHGHPDDG
ncbi:MAG: hypothetical protein D6705_13685 [Deltaproteobacteria bacterium]|nr:MAG: hypothetical protein D6705_13685 [Deltaproteobacteria bacterium]